MGRKEGRLCEVESRQQPDVVQLISQEIFHQLRWELASCSKSSRRSVGTATAFCWPETLISFICGTGFYVYVYVSAIVYSWNYLPHVKELALLLSCVCDITGIRYAMKGIFHVDICCYFSFVIKVPYLLCMCDSASYTGWFSRMTRGTNLIKQLWFIMINNSTCFGHPYKLTHSAQDYTPAP